MINFLLNLSERITFEKHENGSFILRKNHIALLPDAFYFHFTWVCCLVAYWPKNIFSLTTFFWRCFGNIEFLGDIIIRMPCVRSNRSLHLQINFRCLVPLRPLLWSCRSRVCRSRRCLRTLQRVVLGNSNDIPIYKIDHVRFSRSASKMNFRFAASIKYSFFETKWIVTIFSALKEEIFQNKNRTLHFLLPEWQAMVQVHPKVYFQNGCFDIFHWTPVL